MNSRVATSTVDATSVAIATTATLSSASWRSRSSTLHGAAGGVAAFACSLFLAAALRGDLLCRALVFLCVDLELPLLLLQHPQSAEVLQHLDLPDSARPHPELLLPPQPDPPDEQPLEEELHVSSRSSSQVPHGAKALARASLACSLRPQPLRLRMVSLTWRPEGGTTSCGVVPTSPVRTGSFPSTKDSIASIAMATHLRSEKEVRECCAG